LVSSASNEIAEGALNINKRTDKKESDPYLQLIDSNEADKRSGMLSQISNVKIHLMTPATQIALLSEKEFPKT